MRALKARAAFLRRESSGRGWICAALIARLTGHTAIFVCRWLLLSMLGTGSAYAVTDADVIAGFHRVVFGAEFQRGSWPARVVKKFTVPVRFYVEDRSRSSAARRETETFLGTLNSQIRNLNPTIVDDAADANFRVLLVKHFQYGDTVREVFGQGSSGHAPGECLVRIVASPTGIIRSDAVIVTDASGGLFRKCLIEEVLQGLGPINDDSRLTRSVFNDSTRIEMFTAFDKMILNALYHPSVRAGMRPRDVDKLLPGIVRALRSALPQP